MTHQFQEFVLVRLSKSKHGKNLYTIAQSIRKNLKNYKNIFPFFQLIHI